MKFLKRILKKLIVLTLVLVGVWFVSYNIHQINFVYAWDIKEKPVSKERKKENSLKNIAKFINWLLSFLSWFWIIPAIIAWKLMTNWWVYWSNIHLDTYLRQMRRMMVNFANFFLWFLFVWLILWSFLKWSWADLIKNKLPKLIVALVLVNFSWFFIWALVDISNVLTAMVWSIPSSLWFVNKDVEITLPKEVTIDLTKNFWELIKIKDSENKVSLDTILPKYDSVSWPLIFFGASVLGMFDLQPINSNQITWKEILQSSALKLILVIMFILPLIVLAIVNFVRVVWIWIFIIFSPFVIIEAVTWWIFSKKIESFKKLSLSNLIWLIFMPVAVVATLSIGLIFVISLQQMLKNPPDNVKNNPFVKQFVCSNNKSDYVCLKTPTETLYISKNSIFADAWEYATGALGKLIIFWFVIFFLWSLLQVWFKMSELTANISEWIFKFTEEMAKAAPVLPWWLSYWALKIWLSKRMMWAEMFWRIQAKQAESISEFINQLTWIYWKKLTPLERNEIEQELKSSWKTVSQKIANLSKILSEISKKKEHWWSLQTDPELKSIIENLLRQIWNDKNLVNNLWLEDIYTTDKDWKRVLKSDWYNHASVWRFLRALVEGKLKRPEEIKWGTLKSIYWTVWSQALTLDLSTK